MQKYLEISVEAAKGLDGDFKEVFNLEVQFLGFALVRILLAASNRETIKKFVS